MPSAGVPIPPVLVQLIRQHVKEFGVGSDGRLFRTYRGGIYLPSTLWQVLQKARIRTFTEGQAAPPLARKPYDFRHAGMSWCLNTGTPAPLVAEWRGTLSKSYTGSMRIAWMATTNGDTRAWSKLLADRSLRTESGGFLLQVLICTDGLKPVPHMFREPRHGAASASAWLHMIESGRTAKPPVSEGLGWSG